MEKKGKDLLGKKELDKERKQWLSVHKVFSRLWDPFPAIE